MGLYREMVEKHFMQMLETEGFASFEITSQTCPHKWKNNTEGRQ